MILSATLLRTRSNSHSVFRSHALSLFAAVLTLCLGLFFETQAQPLSVPNGSFESPVTSFVDLRIDNWQKNPKPPGFPVTDEQWEQSIGLFKNTDPTAADHIDNMDGNQAIFIFNAPGAGVFQDYDSVDWSGQTHISSATFEPGRAYNLTVGLIGGGGNMPEGVSILLSLYYRDAQSNIVTIASTTVSHSAATFPNTTHFVDFQVAVPMVKGSDAWAGKHIGISITSIGPPEIPGGYWDIDNVRLAVSSPTLALGNPSFESPVTTFVDLRIDDWQKNPKPQGFPVTDEQWEQSIGLFKNTDPGASDHIDNMDGNQAIFIFNAPGAGVFQDYDSIDWSGQTHTTSAKFEEGSAYNLSVGIVGGGGNMPEGASLLISLYYRDASSNVVPVASTTVLHSTNVFPTTTHLVDFQVAVPAVKSTDPWADQYIGVSITSTGPFDKPGGYWDIDNVRLNLGSPDFDLSIRNTTAGLQLTWPSAPGYQYQLRSSPDLKNWSNVDAPQPGTGAPLSKVISQSGSSALFFSVIATPNP
jgi:hypothetical protein